MNIKIKMRDNISYCIYDHRDDTIVILDEGKDLTEWYWEDIIFYDESRILRLKSYEEARDLMICASYPVNETSVQKGIKIYTSSEIDKLINNKFNNKLK